ncbi:hypothetical protein Peur_065535 [Populus x canadensis]
MLHIFCDICIKAIDTGMILLVSIKREQTGHAFTKTQLKNKWDGCKKDWRIWNKLVSEIGASWNSEDIRGAKKFRHVAPSSEVPCGNDINPGISNANIDDDGLEERSGDSEEDGIPDFQTNMSRMVGGINMLSSSNTKSGGRRKDEILLRSEVERRKCLELVFSCC